MLADSFPDSEIVFNVRSKLDHNFEAWVVSFRMSNGMHKNSVGGCNKGLVGEGTER